jgi:RimJ/RimL family protein N-acetyltransferase
MFKYYEESGKSKVFAVRKESTIIGVAGFDDIIKENQVATLFIGLGSENERGKGYGTETMRLLLKYGFENLNFHRIQLNVLEFNDKAIALYEKCGFKKEGIFREFVLRDGKRYNLLLYGLLKSEWEKTEILRLRS